jgi:hypothetical protein
LDAAWVIWEQTLGLRFMVPVLNEATLKEEILLNSKMDMALREMQ